MKITLLSFLLSAAIGAQAQLAPLHVDGRYIKDDAGNVVNLHGFAQTYSPWFNEQGRVWTNYNVAACLKYNKGLIDGILAAGWKMDFVRLHMDPYWSNIPGQQTTGENDISAFDMNRFKKYLDEVFVPMAEYAIGKGMYVVMRPPGVCPENIAVGDAYQQYLLQVWGYVSRHPKLKDNPGILFELANEPVNILDASGQRAGTEELTAFLQPVVDTMRTHCRNILLIPGLGWQSQYAGFVEHPVAGTNIAYAVHCYPGWYNGGHGDDNVIVNYADFKKGWDEQITPITNMAPVIVTEMDWAPGKYKASWGKSYTGVAGGEGFGANFKKLADECGNVGWLLFTGPELLAQFKDEQPASGVYTFLNDPEACPWPCYHWFQEYARQRESEDARRVTAVELATSSYTLLPGTLKALCLMATFADGRQMNVAGDAVYTVSDGEVVSVRGGNLCALREGAADIGIAYTTPQGAVHRFHVSAKVTMFPLTADGFNPGIWEQGAFDEATGTLRTGRWGFGGWKYTGGLDLSAYRYLVVELNRRQSCAASFRLFDEPSYWSDPCMKDFGTSTRLVVDLQDMRKNKSGGKCDPSHLYIIGFWTNGSGDVSIKDVFVSDDGTTPSAILVPVSADAPLPVYNLQGVRVGTSDCMGGMPRGVYIAGGRKIVK